MPNVGKDTKATFIPRLRYRNAPAAIGEEGMIARLWTSGTYDPWA